MGAAKAAGRALLRAALVLWATSLVVFALFFATPGADPAARLAGRGASPERVAAVRAELGLDRAWLVQYAAMMGKLFVSRDLESAVNRGQRVVPSVLRAAPVTAALALGAAVLWVVAGVALGAAGSGRRGGRVLGAVALAGVSVPAYVLAELVAYATQGPGRAAAFAWVPALGAPPEGAIGWLRALALPWLTLAVLYAGTYGRVLRGGIGEALAADYARTARAKGLGEGRVLWRHALPNAAGPALALLGLDLGALLGGGTVLVEVAFGLPGVGRLTYDGLRGLDLPMVLACVLYGAAMVCAATGTVDASKAWLDPRQR